MSTNSTIAVQHQDGTISAIYCHWDGYLAHNGALLIEYYNTLEQAESLVALGDLSSLSPKLEPEGPHSFENSEPNVCVFYGRDRGEDGVDTKHYSSLENYFIMNDSQEFNYLFIDNRWKLVSKKGKLQDVERRLAKKEVMI